MAITDYYLRNGADETVAKNSTWGLMWWRKMSRIFTSSQLGRQCLHASSGTWAADNKKGLNFSFSKNLHWCLLNWTAAQGSHIGVSVFGRYLKVWKIKHCHIFWKTVLTRADSRCCSVVQQSCSCTQANICKEKTPWIHNFNLTFLSCSHRSCSIPSPERNETFWKLEIAF